VAAALQSLFPKLGLSKKALLLGAGFVTKPTVQILSDAGIDVTFGMLQ
jgi:saccharopine dehydrogenase (NADP+, L-glutamate forming)